MIHVMIADDFGSMRYVMQQLLERTPDIRVVAEADTFTATMEVCRQQPCDVIILDDFLPPYYCEVAIAQLRQANVTTPILVTSMHADMTLAGKALDKAGGFILKTELPEQLAAAVRALHAGQTFLSPRMAGQMKPPASK